MELTNLNWKRWVMRLGIIVAMVILAYDMSSCDAFCLIMECISGCNNEGCSYCPGFPFPLESDSPGVYSGDQINQSEGIWVYYEFGATGIFTPTNGIVNAGGGKLEGVSSPAVSSWETILQDARKDGFIAIRVPHAPPTFTVSSIVSPTVTFSYYAPPTSTVKTTVPITFTRRADLDVKVENKFPSDQTAHWEVWWLPDEFEIPIPDKPFRLASDEFPHTVNVRFGIDLGVPGESCAGCTLEYVYYNGSIWIGPYKTAISLYPPDLAGNPKLFFDECYGASQPTITTVYTPTVPITIEHCLMNLDDQQHTATFEISSSQNWDYTFYTQANTLTSEPVPWEGEPITLEPQDWGSVDDEIRFFAVFTPTETIDLALQETYILTATSTITPSIQTTTYSMVFGRQYTLDLSGSKVIFLPMIIQKQNP
jgi:hypothetical protein